MPDALEPVSAGANDHRGGLAARGTVLQGRKVIAKWLQAVEKVVYILDLGDRPETAEGHADALAHDGEFPDAGIEDAVGAVSRLQARKALIDVADLPQVFAKGKHLWVAGKEFVEI